MISGNRFRTRADLVIFVMLALLPPLCSSSVDAGERFYNGGAGGTGVRELPLYVAKDLGTFEKYGLDVELIATNGGSPLVQALVGGSLQSASVAAMAPIRAISSGANLVIVAGCFYKNILFLLFPPQLLKNTIR